MAVGKYSPPPLIRWPIVVGLLAIVLWLVPVLFLGGSPSREKWLLDHQATINALNRDQGAIADDNPSLGGTVAKWKADLQTFQDDVAAAASLPNPGGSATAPWREMINDYIAYTTDVLQGLNGGNQGLLARAQREKIAGDQAAEEFNHALGVA